MRNDLTYRAYTTTGELYDEATISKDFESGKKTIRQKVPDVEERTFEGIPKADGEKK